MKKNERLLTVMASLRYERCNGMNEFVQRPMSTSYDVARTQMVTQPHAWRLLQVLVQGEMVRRMEIGQLGNSVVMYTLTEDGYTQLKERRISLINAMKVLDRYKMEKYRKSLK